MKRLYFFLFFRVLVLPVAQAQVSVQVLVPPPYSPYLYDYQTQYADRNAIVLTNTSQQTINIMLRGELKGRNNGIRVYTSPNYRPARPIELTPGQSQRFTLGETNQDYLDRKNLEVAGVDAATQNQILTTGLLPPGAYDLCLLAYRYDNGQPIGTPFQGCTFLNITYLEPPRLIQPLCGREVLIRPNEPNQTVFSWNPPVGNLTGTPLAYDFYLVKVPPGQNPNDAINNAIDRRIGNPFIERDLTATFFTYGIAEPALAEGQYAWRVIARDPNRQVVFQNQGRSDYCSFTTRNAAVPQVVDVVKKEVLVQAPAAQKPVISAVPMQTMNLLMAPASPCKDVPAPVDKVPVAGNYLNQAVTIGLFTLTIDDIKADGGGYTGQGRIKWNGVPVRVAFTTIQINSNRQVIAGFANGIDDAFRVPGVDLGSTDLNGLQQLDGSTLKTYVENLKNNLFDQAKAAVAVPLPLGYDAGSGLIGINYMRFTPTGADMGLVFNMEMPEADSYLALAGVGICMAPDKVIPSNALLYLLKDLKIPFAPLTFLKGNLAPVNPSGTFAELTAVDGLKRIHGELALNLGSSILQLDDGNGNTLPGDVTATLKTDFTKWADWVADVQLPPAFALAPLSGFTLKGVSITYDHSDLRNPAGFSPPAEYTGERGPTFQGVYMNELQVLLPKAFLGQGGNRTGFAAKGCLFTDGEFTGRLAPAKTPLLDYNTGSLGNWGFSIDDFEVLFVQNRYERSSMNGKIQFPISDDYFTYTATLRDNLKNLQLVVQPKTGGYTVPLWAANMTIAETSHILVGLQNSSPVMDIQLNGNILLNTSNLPKVVSLVLPNLYFEQFTVSNLSKPGAASGGGVYVNPGNWKLVGGIFKDTPATPPADGARKGSGPFAPEMADNEWTGGAMAPGNSGGLAGFPIEIAPPKMVVNAKGFGVELGAYVSLGEASANIVQASGFVQILGNISLVNKRPKASLAGVYPTRFGVKGSFGGGTVDAAIDIYNGDPKYGDGFKGVGKVNIPALAEVEATVQFGKVSGFYYAYADASVVLASGIPIAPPTPLLLNGVGGGFYYNMVPDNPVVQTTITNRVAPAVPTPGFTNSGTAYRPQQGGWGIKARVYVAMADPHLMTSSLEVEASFVGSALNQFRLTGLANVMDADGSIKTPDDAMEKILRAEFIHDVAQKSYMLSIDLKANFFTNTAIIPIRAYFDPAHYHVMLGDPFGQRMEADIYNYNVGLVKVNLKANAYVAFGNDLPGIPPLPPRVEDFLGTGESASTSAAVQNQRQGVFNQVASSGSGPLGGDFVVLLGAGLKADLNVSVPPLAINAGGDIGFDAALFFNAECAGSNTGAAGLFGWYGEVQLYAYVFGSIDIDVDIFGYSGLKKLCGLSAGAMLRGGVPNPTWAKGKVRAKGEILDGLISFDASANISFGDKCVPKYGGDPLAKVIIIQELRPMSDKPVTTDTPMAAVFNVSMNQEYIVQLPDNTSRTYRFGLGTYSLTYVDAAGKQQTFPGLGAPVWTDYNQLLLLPINSGQMAGTRQHTFALTATIEELSPGGSFKFLVDGNGNRRVETKSVRFTTLAQPDEILIKNVAYQYPLDGQLYCLKGQVPQGLVAGNLPNEALTKPGYRYEAVFVPKEPGTSLRVPFSYRTGNERYPSQVVFDLPPGLQTEKTYRLELHRIANGISPVVTGLSPAGTKIMLPNVPGVQETRSDITSKQPAIQGTATVRQNRLSGEIQMNGNALVTDKILYAFAFRTSRYNTFAEKAAALRFAPTQYANATNATRPNYLTYTVAPQTSVENFEDAELFGYRAGRGPLPPMLQPKALSPLWQPGHFPYEKVISDNTYEVLLTFFSHAVTISYDQFPERSQSGWLLYFPPSAVQSQRSRSLLSQLATTTLGVGGAARFSTPVLVPDKTVVADNTIGAGQAIQSAFNRVSDRTTAASVLLSYFYRLNPEPTGGYQFFIQRDRIANYDWQAVRGFGTSLYRWRQQAKAMFPLAWRQFVEGSKGWQDAILSTSSPTLTLSSDWRSLAEAMPDNIIDQYALPDWSFSNGPAYPLRPAGSTSAIDLQYTPYPDGPRQTVRKTFLFTGSPSSGGVIAAPR